MSPFTPLIDDSKSPILYQSINWRLEASIREPPCDCYHCANSFLSVRQQLEPAFSYRSRLSDKEAERTIVSIVESIHRSRALLQKRLAGFGDVLLSRWKKKSQSKREALLKEAAPYLEEKQWLDSRYAYMRERFYFHARSRTRRHQLLLPWLNVEVLKANPAVLLALLHYRTAYSPHHWVPFGNNQLASS